MKLSAEQFSNQLTKKTLSPIYWISGEDTFLRQEARDQIRETAKQLAFDQPETYHVETGFSWPAFLEETKNFSLFSNKKMIELHLPLGKLNDSAKTCLTEYAADPSSDTLLIVLTEKIEMAMQQAAWFKKLMAQVAWLPVWPLSAAQLPFWIRDRLKQKGLSTDLTSVKLIAAHVEGNLLAAQQMIEKLSLCYGKKSLSLDEITQILTPNAHYTIFDFSDSLLGDDLKRNLTILRSLKAEGTEPTLILWAISREMRALLAMIQQQQEGLSLEAILNKNKVWEKRKPLFRQAMKRLSKEKLQQILLKCALIDQMIKGVLNENVWTALSQLCVQLHKNS